MTTTTQTAALQAFSHNLSRLTRFMQLAKSLDLSDTEVLKIRQEFYWQLTGDELLKIRDEAVTQQPNLEAKPAELLLEVSKLQRQREEGFIVEQLGQYHRLRDELALIQLVAFADAYRNEATALLFRKKTSVLIKHKADIIKALSDLTTPLDWDELYDEIIRVAVNNMTRNIKYRGWVEKIKNDFSLTPSISGSDMDLFEEIIATRNVLAHNSGIVNKDYQDRSLPHFTRIKLPMPPISSLRQIDQLYCTSAIQCVERVLHGIDSEIYRTII